MKYIETSVLSRASQRVNNNFYFKYKKNMSMILSVQNT